MTDSQIKNIFDSNWGITLQELSKQTGKTVPQLKKILMGQEYKMIVGRKSMISGIKTEMDINVTEKQVTLWMEGALIQDVMPNLTPTERDFIRTGMTPMEQADMVPVLYSEGEFQMKVGLVNPVAKAMLQLRKSPQVVPPKKGGKAKRNRKKDTYNAIRNEELR